MNPPGSSEGLSSEQSAAADASGRSGAGFDLPLDLAARSRMASLRDAMFGVSTEPARVDRFIILETLGAGGMGVVHAAHDPRLDRRIALKLVRPEAAAGAAVEARLLREAQAMARLSHPNVVQIHEVGAWEGRVFIAMELVAGQSLAAWLAARSRGWREIVGVFLEAGRGLAAAHAVGMVHRDFKPENVLVGDDGRVRVTDFGLARGERRAEECGETWRESEGPLASICADVTVETAGFAGTPRYMSPEQFRGEAATSASDQFSYCVALYQALHGIHPFAAEDRSALTDAVLAGKRREPPRIRIPRAIHRALVRGLSHDPGARFSQLPELLAAIEPRSRWRKPAPAALFLLTGAGAAGLLVDRDHCTDTETLLADTWDVERRAAAENAFTASRIGHAPVLWSTTAQELDAYTEQVKQSYTASCQAERRGESTAALHDLRVACLYRRLNVMRGVVDELVTGDLDALRRGPQAVLGLGALDTCVDGRTLVLGIEAPPASQAVKVGRVEARIDQARSLELVGHLPESRSQSVTAQAEAEELGYAPLIAEALFQQGRLDVLERGFTRAEEALREAMALAVGARHDRLVGELWSWLIQAVVLGRGDARGADELLQQAEAWLRRSAASPLQRAELDRAWGTVYQTRGDHVAAEAAIHRALKIHEAVLGAERLDVSIERLNHANLLDSLGHLDEALAVYHRVLISMQARVGPEHPLVGDVHYNLGVALLKSTGPDAPEQAANNLLRSHAIIEAQRGPHAIELADSHLALAQAATLRKDSVETQGRVAAALAIYGHHPGHPDRAYALLFAGTLQFEQGRLDEALATHSEARALALAAWGETSHVVGAADSNIGDILLAKKDFAAALGRYAAAITVTERVLGPDSAELIGPLRGTGAAEQARGNPCEALAAFDEALALMKANEAASEEFTATAIARAAADEACEKIGPADLEAPNPVGSSHVAG